MSAQYFPTRFYDLSVFKEDPGLDKHSFRFAILKGMLEGICVGAKLKETHRFYSFLLGIFTWFEVDDWGFDAQGEDEASIEVDWNFRPVYKKGCDFVIVGVPFGMNRETNFYFADMVPNQESNCKQRYYKPDYCDPIKSLDGWRFNCRDLSHKRILPKHKKGKRDGE